VVTHSPLGPPAPAEPRLSLFHYCVFYPVFDPRCSLAASLLLVPAPPPCTARLACPRDRIQPAPTPCGALPAQATLTSSSLGPSGSVPHHHTLLAVCANGPVPASRSRRRLACYAVFNFYDCCDAFHLEFVYTAHFDIIEYYVAGTTVRQSRWMQDSLSLVLNPPSSHHNSQMGLASDEAPILIRASVGALPCPPQ